MRQTGDRDTVRREWHTKFVQDFSHQLHILSRLHKGDGDEVHLVFAAEVLHVVDVLCSKHWQVHPDARQVHIFALAKDPVPHPLSLCPAAPGKRVGAVGAFPGGPHKPQQADDMLCGPSLQLALRWAKRPRSLGPGGGAWDGRPLEPMTAGMSLLMPTQVYPSPRGPPPTQSIAVLLSSFPPPSCSQLACFLVTRELLSVSILWPFHSFVCLHRCTSWDRNKPGMRKSMRGKAAQESIRGRA